MNAPQNNEITRLLEAWSDGESEAINDLMPLIYQELRLMAKQFMNSQPSGHTLQTTALIHEAYLKLVNQREKNWENRTHFFAVAAQTMRHILVDHARARRSGKRGGKNIKIGLEEVGIVSLDRVNEIIELDEALQNLLAIDERKARVVELRYFGGLSVEETADVLKVSPETVARDWRFAKTWLLRELQKS